MRKINFISTFIISTFFKNDYLNHLESLFKMSLSLDKLHKLLLEKGFMPVNHFYYNGCCRYIELVSSEYAEHFLLTISSKYDLKLREGDTGYKMKLVPIDDSGRIPEKYAKLPDNIEMSNMYNEIDLIKNQDAQDEFDIESRLIDGYKKNITLNTSDNNINELKDIFNQLKRISHCLSNLPYRCSIFHKVWVSTLDAEYDIECFYIKNYKPESNRKFVITISLENFLQSSSNIASDVDQINQGMSRILDKNIASHTGHLYSALQSIPVLGDIIPRIQSKKATYSNMLANFLVLLDASKKKEKELKIQLESIMLAKAEGNIYTDMDKARIRSNIERELEKLRLSRDEILGNIMRLKERERNITLMVDKILFENVVMLGTVNYNLKLLHSMCK